MELDYLVKISGGGEAKFGVIVYGEGKSIGPDLIFCYNSKNRTT